VPSVNVSTPSAKVLSPVSSNDTKSAETTSPVSHKVTFNWDDGGGPDEQAWASSENNSGKCFKKLPRKARHLLKIFTSTSFDTLQSLSR
jgi:hypothetical protein